MYNVSMKTIAITMGEPGGVGPEIALKSIINAGVDFKPVLVGDPDVFHQAARMLAETGTPLPFSLGSDLEIIETGSSEGFTKGSPSKSGGDSAQKAIVKATELAMGGEVDAIVTAPISKEAMKMAGHNWPGHTELLAELTGTKDFAMMLVGGGLRVMLVTIHEALSDVSALITKVSVARTLRLASRASEMLSLPEPKIAVCGLNPHAGEGGMFGREELESIIPAINEANKEGINASGPHPADSLFYRAHKGEFDLVVSMYHDQGLVPLKLLGFDTGVNITVGLPIIRTSPDHGTAYDIAWRGTASPQSMKEAIRLAVSLKLS